MSKLMKIVTVSPEKSREMEDDKEKEREARYPPRKSGASKE